MLEYNWLSDHNPSIDWREGMLAFKQVPESTNLLQKEAAMNLEEQKKNKL